MRKVGATVVLLSLLVCEGAFAVDRDGRGRSFKERVKTLVMRVLDMLGTPPG